ncbi:THAP-type domain-containing protein [Caerostris extrusa]|uniref:THAP-type domain-containing protein n=1 Tax=Caerostris extrusa TaxID=172846 RepID=A0AAV4VXQ3_CAEEX|nr:THAP-type domain-containing protein [Caerostris extrusa]
MVYAASQSRLRNTIVCKVKINFENKGNIKAKYKKPAINFVILLLSSFIWMPSKCFVFGCRSNYNRETKVRVFSFPRNDELKQKWIEVICRKDKRQPSKASKICALHFKPEDIITEASGFNSKTQQFITVPLQKYRLRPNVVPCIFENLSPTEEKRNFSRKKSSDVNKPVKESQDLVPNAGSRFRNLWQKKIGCPHLKITENIGVCIKHFEKNCVVDYKEWKSEGNRKRTTVKHGAVPTIFELDVNYSSKGITDSDLDVITVEDSPEKLPI